MARRSWNPCSAVNTRHLAHMLRGGSTSYFQALADGFALAAASGKQAGVDSLRDFLPADVDDFMGGSRVDVKAAKEAAANDARVDIYNRLINDGMKKAEAKELAGL